MKSSVAFFGLSLLALTLVSSALLQADDPTNMTDPSSQVSWMPMAGAEVYNNQAAMASKGLEATAPSSMASQTKPMQVGDCPRSGPYLSIEYLYWKVEEEQMYPFYLDDQVKSSDEISNDSRLKSQKFEFTSGFRAAIGYDLPYEKYDLCFAWTRIHPHTSMHLSSSADTQLVSALLQGITSGDSAKCQSASSKWHLAFDMLDLELGRKYVVGKRLFLRPNIGLKGGWIDQTQSCSINGVDVQQRPLILGQGVTKRKNDFQGIGPRLGIDMRYGIGSQFGLFGTLSGALLYGHFDMKTYLNINPSQNANSPQTYNLINSRSRLTPTAQMLLGGDWSRCLYQKWWIRFGAAYEVQFWWDQLGANTSFTDLLIFNYSSGGDLMMHGLTLQARFDF